MKIFRETLIDPIFDVESIGDVPRVPRAHLEVVFSISSNEFRASPVCVLSFVCIYRSVTCYTRVCRVWGNGNSK